jgi:2'-hydroxyisoflavone reductase
VLDAMNGALGGAARFVYADSKWIQSQDAAGWGNFPLVVADESEQAGFGHVSAARAIAAGLRFRSVADTTLDALAGWKAAGQPALPGIDRGKEAELLARWHARPA